jgi:hypothetical protein
MAGTSMCWALHSTIWALRHRTTEPEPRRMIERSLFPSSLEMSLTATRSAMPHFARPGAQSSGRGPGTWPVTALVPCQASFASARMAQTRRSGAVQLGAIPCGSVASELQSPSRGHRDYDQSSARRDHHASAAAIAPSASRMPSPTSPAVAAQCRGTRARAPGSHRYSSRVNGSGAVLS